VCRAAAAVLLLAAAVVAVVLPLGGRIPDRLVGWWCRRLVRATGVRVRVTGEAVPPGGVLLVAHHVSWLDVPLLAAVRPARMLAKAEIGRWPLAGRLAARGGALFVDRDRLRELPSTVEAMAGVLAAGGAVAVFPEGTTWCGRARGPFRRAAFQAALDAGVPVLPVRLRYRRADGSPATEVAFVGDDTLLASFARVVTARGVTAEVEVGPFVTPTVHADRRALALAAEAASAEGLPPQATGHGPGLRTRVGRARAGAEESAPARVGGGVRPGQGRR
jgi:1-acyl-sn-glycerol-3-phosphate acyltransferase